MHYVWLQKCIELMKAYMVLKSTEVNASSKWSTSLDDGCNGVEKYRMVFLVHLLFFARC